MSKLFEARLHRLATELRSRHELPEPGERRFIPVVWDRMQGRAYLFTTTSGTYTDDYRADLVSAARLLTGIDPTAQVIGRVGHVDEENGVVQADFGKGDHIFTLQLDESMIYWVKRA